MSCELNMESLHFGQEMKRFRTNNSISDELDNSPDKEDALGSSTSSLDSAFSASLQNFSSRYAQPGTLAANTQRPIAVRASQSQPALHVISGLSNGNGLHCDESLEEKVEALEGKVSQQTCEIVLLKSALADVLRRLCVVEETSKRHKGRLIPATPTTQSMVLASPRSQGQSRLPTRSKSPSDLPRSLPVPDTEQGSVRRPLRSNLDSFSWSHSPRKDGSEIPKINCDRPISPTNSKRIDKFTEPNDSQHQALHQPSALVKAILRSSRAKSPVHRAKSPVPREVKSEAEPTVEPMKSAEPQTNGAGQESNMEELSEVKTDAEHLMKQEFLTNDNPDVFTKKTTRENMPVIEKAKPKRSKSILGNGSSTSELHSRHRSVAARPLRKSWGSESDLSTRPRSKTLGSTPSLSSSGSPSPIRKQCSTGSTNPNLKGSRASSAIRKEEGTSKDETSIKMYIRGRAINAHAPSNFKEAKNAGQAPDATMELDWIYGYRGRDCRNNLFYLPTGEVIYNMAAVVVLYNGKIGTQRHYTGHNDDVKCIALHPNKVIVASGQVAGHDKDEGRPHVRIWDSSTLETLRVLGVGDFERALCCLAFSIEDGGKHLIAVDEANEHVISLWDWEKKVKFTETKGSMDAVLGLAVHPNDNNAIVSCGKSHIAFWTVTADKKLTKKMGVFEKFGKPKFVLCIAFTAAGDLLSGDSNGNIFVWPKGKNHISQAMKNAHEGPVFSLCTLSDGGIVSGGGRDRRLVLWDSDYNPLGEEIELPEAAGPVRAITIGESCEDGKETFFVGTTKNCLLSGSFHNGMSFLMKGHTDEMWGLAIHPSENKFVTCAYDRQLYMWNADSHEAIWGKQMEDGLQSAAFHPDGSVIAVGTLTGKWMVLEADTSEEIVSFQDGPEQHDAIKYSPDGKYIAVGSHDNFIYLYTVSEDGRGYKKHGKLSGHSSFVTHLDWSKDSCYIQSNSGDYEILYWHAQRCKHVTSAVSMRDVEWATWTCVLGFPVCGIWPEGADGTDINACCRSDSEEFLITGDDFGQVNFFRYPCTKIKSECRHCVGHSSHVTCVRFLRDNSRAISVGGKDSSIMQWRIVR